MARLAYLFKKALVYLRDPDVDFFDFVYLYLRRNNLTVLARILNVLLIKVGYVSAIVRSFEYRGNDTKISEHLLDHQRKLIIKSSNVTLLIEALAAEPNIPLRNRQALARKILASFRGSNYFLDYQRLRIFLNIGESFEVSGSGKRVDKKYLIGTYFSADPVVNGKKYSDKVELKYCSPRIISSDNSVRHSFTNVLPEIGVAIIERCSLIPNEIIFDEKNYYALDKAIVFNGAPLAGKLSPLVQVYGGPDMMGICYAYSKEYVLEHAVSFAGRSASNYFHWLIEYMPRLYMALDSSNFASIKCIVPGDLYPQQVEVLAIMGAHDLVKMEDDAIYRIKKLIVPAYHTAIYDDLKIPFNKSTLFSPALLKGMAAFIKSKLSVNAKGESQKIFLSRRKRYFRTLKNIESFEAYFIDVGYKVVYPEDHSFSEQVKIFEAADIIVGPSGASFANLIFCRPGTKVFALLAEHNKDFSLFSCIADAFDLEFYNIPCDTIRINADKITMYTSDFHADPSKVYEQMAKVL